VITVLMCHCAVECNESLDLVFLVDDSTSIKEQEWPAVQRFLTSVAQRFNVGRTTTRVGIVRYSTTASIIYRLSSFQSSSAISGAIFRMRHLGGSTNLALAMRMAFQNVFVPASRPGSAKVGCFY